LRTEDGSPFGLLPFQRAMLRPYFEGARETALLIPKKNGKTTLMAALALYHLVVTPEAECIIVAASRDQAELTLRQARMFIRTSEPLGRLVKVLQRSILSTVDDGRIRVLAADADTADGVIPTLAIVDELHRHKSAELYGVMADGLGPRNGQLVTISTAGASMDSPLGEIRRKAHELTGFSRKGKHNTARSADGAFVFHEWCLSPEDDPTDMAVVKRANPAPWHTERSLRERHDEPAMTPWRWLRFACGVWTEGEEPWIDPQAWDRLAEPGMNLESGEDVFVSVDVGLVDDTTGIAIVVNRSGKFYVKARILRPTPRKPVALEEIERELRDIAGSYRVRAVAYDPWNFKRSAELLEREGMVMAPMPQSAETMSQASATLYRVIEAGELVHDGDQALRAQVVAGVTKQTERGWRLVKDPKARSRKVDALIALAMGVFVASANAPRKPLLVT
jgi:phage terminase large subunit-like protein